MKSICCVLKSGGDFNPSHVAWLKTQCDTHMPEWEFKCWSDMRIGIPLKNDWPKWWGKFEIYASDLKGPALIIDIDTVFVKPLVIKPEHEGEDIIIRDPWRDGTRSPERLGGGFMYLQEASRKKLLQAWDGSFGDDQPLIHKVFGDTALRFQDHYLDEVVSYKAQVRGLGLQPENRVVFFHGTPRPYDLSEDWIPKL